MWDSFRNISRRTVYLYMTYFDLLGGAFPVVLWGSLGVGGVEVVLSLVSLVLKQVEVFNIRVVGYVVFFYIRRSSPQYLLSN